MTNEDIPEVILDQLMTEIIKRQDAIIGAAMKETGLVDINLEEVTRKISANGAESWYYKDKMFLRMFPFEYKEVTDGQTVKLIATQQIEKKKIVLTD